jgi:hypothetical protein
MQIALQSGGMASGAELLVNSTKEPLRQPDQVRAAKPVIERDDLADMAPH